VDPLPKETIMSLRAVRNVRFPALYAAPILLAVPLLVGADGQGCSPGGRIDIGSGEREGGGACDCGAVPPVAPCPNGAPVTTTCTTHADGSCSWEVSSCTADAGAVCTAIGCAKNCPNGFLKDSNGCNTCECAADAGVACLTIGCATNCPNGFLKDSNGCDTCKCAPSGCAPGVACQPGSGCGTAAPAGANACTTTCTCGAAGVLECQIDCTGAGDSGGGAAEAGVSDAGAFECGVNGTACCPTASPGPNYGCADGLLCCIGVPYPTEGVCHASCPLVSDYHVKSGFEGVDVDAVLRGVASMSITTWSYDSEPSHARHMGPVAQEFREAFGLGNSDQRIEVVDGLGVAFASIQALDRAVDEVRSENRELRSENAALARQVEAARSGGTSPR
jgi:hypothetical protein